MKSVCFRHKGLLVSRVGENGRVSRAAGDSVVARPDVVRDDVLDSSWPVRQGEDQQQRVEKT